MVDDEASGVAQAVRTETRTVTVVGHNQEVNALGDCSDDFALNPSPTMNKLSVLPSEPRCRGFQDLQGLLVRDLLEMADGPVRAKARPSSPAVAASVTSPTSEGVTWRSVTRVSGGRIWAAASRHPCHVPSTNQMTTLTGCNHPTNLSDTHRARVDASSTGGTVTTPRRRNSEAGSSSPRLRSTRRQSRVASEPT